MASWSAPEDYGWSEGAIFTFLHDVPHPAPPEYIPPSLWWLVCHTLPVIPDQSRKRPRGVLPLGLFLPSIVPGSIIPMRCLWQSMFLVGIRTHALFTKQPRPIRFVSPVTAFVEHVCGFVAIAAINADNAQEITATPPLEQTVHFTPPCVFGDVKTISGNCQPYN